MRAQIVKNDKREFTCLTEDGREVVRATALGNLLKADEGLVVGDWVELAKERDLYHITKLCPRQNTIYRRHVRENKLKIQAANIDLIVVVVSLVKPPFRQGLVDRYLMRAFDWQIPVVLVFNKYDLFVQGEKERDFELEFEIDRLQELGLKTFIVSAKNAECQFVENEKTFGLASLKQFLHGKLAFFTGQSGVGKSELINSLSEMKVTLRTSAISKVGKGSHTTTWSEIISGGNFRIVDSPGVKSYAIDDIEQDICIELFPDLFNYARHCQFANCQHTEEIPGCEIIKEIKHRRAGENGDYRARLLESRLDSFQRILPECGQFNG